MGDIREWKFSVHAVDRALDMALSAEELRRAILQPEITRRAAAEHQRIHTGGRISVVLDVTVREVITILWKSRRGEDFVRGQDEGYFRDN